MSAIVKAQLLKHLSKFVKNLSADHLTLKLLQGAGDIDNIDLNEDLLSTTLGLPPWLRLTRVHCNRMSIRLHWTRLTSEPIYISLDVVYVDLEARQPSDSSKSDSSNEKSSSQQQSASVSNPLRMPYGFINKAIDGISLSINTIKVHFRAGTFFASLELSHVTLHSCLPNWSRDIKHLKNTRIKNGVTKQVLLFKIGHCNTLRLETSEVPADGSTEQSSSSSKTTRLTPFRVIINRLAAKLQFKRSLTDSAVLCTKLNCEVDDILSVLTDAQAQVGLRFINHLRKLSAGSSVELAAKRAALARTLAASISIDSGLSKEQQQAGSASKQQPQQQTSGVSVTATTDYHRSHAYFISNDFCEHSTHVKLQRVDLHLVAERASMCNAKKPLTLLDPILLEGAIRLSLENLSFNLYPAHVFGSGHKGWPRYHSLFTSERANMNENFQGCFEAVAYGSIDAFKLYTAQLPHENNPNQICISICGARKWPAIYFDSSQIVSENDLTILDSRNAMRVSRVQVEFHLATLLYLLVTMQDVSELFQPSEQEQETTDDKAPNRCTKVELCDVDFVYQPPSLSARSKSSADRGAPEETAPAVLARPVTLISFANIVAQFVEQPKNAMTAPSFSDNVEVNEVELYSFLHSFLLSGSENDFEAKCTECCFQIEKSHRYLWHLQFNSIFARTVTAQDGDIPLLYCPKITGFLPKNIGSHAMLKCDPVEGPLQLFAERSQFDDFLEMLQCLQNFTATVQRSLHILKSSGSSISAAACEGDSEFALSSSTGDQPSTIVFLCPIISIRLLLPAVPPLVVPLTRDASTNTGDNFSNSLLQDSVSPRTIATDSFKTAMDQPYSPNVSGDRGHSASTTCLVQTNEFPTNCNESEMISLIGAQELLVDRNLQYAEQTSVSTLSLDDNSNIVSSSSSSNSMVDFVVVKTEDQLEEADDDDDVSSDQANKTFVNPLDPSMTNFGLQGGSQEVVTVHLVIEGSTFKVETSEDENAMTNIELRFDRLGPINKPRVMARRDVYYPLDLPLSPETTSNNQLNRRQFRAVVSEAEPHAASSSPSEGRLCIDVWLAPQSLLPSVSMSAVNALAHFIAPDVPPPSAGEPNNPPLIRIHSTSNTKLSLKMDTPNVYDRLPVDLIRFVPPPPSDKETSAYISCPLSITQDGYDLFISDESSTNQQSKLQVKIAKLEEENRQLKRRLEALNQPTDN